MRKILDVIKENEAIACKTHEEAKEYCKLCHEQGIKWADDLTTYKYIDNWHIYESNTVYLPHRWQYGHCKKQKKGVVVISFEEFKRRLTEGSESKEETKMNKTESKQTSNVDYDARRYELVKMIMEYVTINSTSDAILGNAFASKVFETADYIVEQLKRKENE